MDEKIKYPTLDSVIERLKELQGDNYIDTDYFVSTPVGSVGRVGISEHEFDVINNIDIKHVRTIFSNGLYEEIMQTLTTGETGIFYFGEKYIPQTDEIGLTSILSERNFFWYVLAIGLGSELKYSDNINARPEYNKEIGRLSGLMLNPIGELEECPARIELINYDGFTKLCYSWGDELRRRVYQRENGEDKGGIIFLMPVDKKDFNINMLIFSGKGDLDESLIHESLNYVLSCIPEENIGRYVITPNDYHLIIPHKPIVEEGLSDDVRLERTQDGSFRIK